MHFLALVRPRSFLAAIIFALALPLPAPGQSPSTALAGNLLRNADFQDDWITLLPETKNHHWCFPSEFFNRRDFNPDSWFCKGSWQWLNAEALPGQRRLLLTGPGAEVMQRVNWVAIHDDRALEGFPDAGGFPVMKAARSQKPERLVRDLTLRVLLVAKDVPAGAGQIEVGLCSPGGTASSDPMGTLVPPTASATVPLPAGSYERWVEVQLPAVAWLKAAKEAADKNPKEKAEVAAAGWALPATALVALRYTAKAGSVEVRRAELTAAPAPAANLLANGGFEDADAAGYPVGWSKAEKYRYFPPRHYYIFNTWHNANFANRGSAAADALIRQGGGHSLRMVVASGDEMTVLSDAIPLNQKEVRLIEVSAWIRTDRLCMLQIDAVTDQGQRLDGFNFIHKAPVSIGTDDWRLVRQVFRPRTPVKSLRLALCARGVNGYTLDDTRMQPQNNVVGTVWWDDVRLTEPESEVAELAARGLRSHQEKPGPSGLHLENLDLGERLLGDNVLRATLVNTGAAGPFTLEWEFTSPAATKSRYVSERTHIPTASSKSLEVPYKVTEICPEAYTEYRGTLTVRDGQDKAIGASELWFGTWTTPLVIDLGGLYLRPEQKQFVRMNLGLTGTTLARLKTIRLEVTRRGTDEVLHAMNVDATPANFMLQRQKIPAELRDDFANLLLADLDVSFLPVQPFADPQRNWRLRARAIGIDGKEMARAESQPFCRQAHDAPQPPIGAVTIKGDLLFINGKPWLPFGVTYGHTPVYAGPAEPGVGKVRDLANLPGWSMYDRHNSESSNRRFFDFNCMRYVAGSVTPEAQLEKRWQADNLYCSTAFAVGQPVFSMAEFFKHAGGKDKAEAYLSYCRKAPMIVSVAPGIEEGFGLFHGAKPEQIAGLKQVVEHLRQQTGKPVMVGHGGYWNRLELEKVPFFDIFDPETEPLFPANIHTDLRPLVQGKDKVVWLRPQMYESIPYERWRFHTFVELMRGCRGWQIAHGPGDASLFRGLHGELEFFKPIVASADAGPKIDVEPWLEHWSRRHDAKTYLIVASTHGIPLGDWQTTAEAPQGSKTSRLTTSRHELRDESNAYGIGQDAESGPACHGMQYLPDAKSWPRGTRLVQWVRLDAKAQPKNLIMLVKGDGRWTHAATWGKADFGPLRKDSPTAYWFLNTFYRHAKGFLGWGMDLLPKALEYIPEKSVAMGPLPPAGQWLKLDLPLETVGATGKLLDGVGFMHEEGRVWWGQTTLVGPDGETKIVWGDSVGPAADDLAKVKISVRGLKPGTKVRVLFEDREIPAADGFFVDDFRGQDLYQRYGGGLGTGYGDTKVALHLYEIR